VFVVTFRIDQLTVKIGIEGLVQPDRGLPTQLSAYLCSVRQWRKEVFHKSAELTVEQIARISAKSVKRVQVQIARQCSLKLSTP